MKILLIFIILIFSYSCSKKRSYIWTNWKKDSYVLYKEAIDAFDKNDFFFASKKFSEAELNFKEVDFAAKAAIMSAYSLYSLNFYEEALENLDRYLKIYPSDKNIIYAHFNCSNLFWTSQWWKNDIAPTIKANEKINFFLEKYPDTDYAIDLKFKKDLIENQLAAKEMYLARYYVSVKKWIQQ